MDRPLLLHPLLHLLVLDVLVFGYDKVVVAVIGRIADRLSLEAKPVNRLLSPWSQGICYQVTTDNLSMLGMTDNVVAALAIIVSVQLLVLMWLTGTTWLKQPSSDGVGINNRS
jgi:hypothetical protein